MLVPLSRTMLTRFAADPGTIRLTMLPASTLKRENELKAFAPRCVPVVTAVTLPWIARPVAVRPSGTICCAVALADASAAHTATAHGDSRGDACNTGWCCL